MKLTKKEVFSIPNILSFVRILLIPVFMVFYLTAKTPLDYYIAAAVILISGLTDMADGLIARKCHMITELGKVLDPIADKLTQAAIVFTLIFRFPAMFFLFVLLAVKEIFMGVNGLILLKKGKKLDGAMWKAVHSSFVRSDVYLHRRSNPASINRQHSDDCHRVFPGAFVHPVHPHLCRHV